MSKDREAFDKQIADNTKRRVHKTYRNADGIPEMCFDWFVHGRNSVKAEIEQTKAENKPTEEESLAAWLEYKRGLREMARDSSNRRR